jgi:hypothetical protein
MTKPRCYVCASPRIHTYQRTHYYCPTCDTIYYRATGSYALYTKYWEYANA